MKISKRGNSALENTRFFFSTKESENGILYVRICLSCIEQTLKIKVNCIFLNVSL